MFDVGQKVTVITDKGIAYDGVILSRATGDDGAGAYKVTLEGSGPEQLGQWHKAGDVFVREKAAEETQDVWENLEGK
jgi:hypothetical protein